MQAEVFGIGAIGAVHTHPTTSGDETHDVVAGHGCAALGQLRQRAGRSRYRDAGVLGAALPNQHRGRRGPLREFVFSTFGTAELSQQSLHDVACRRVTLADSGVQRRHVGVAQLLRQCAHRLAVDKSLQRQTAATNFPGYRLLTRFQRFLATLLGEPLPDLRLGPRRHHETLPVPRRAGGGRF